MHEYTVNSKCRVILSATGGSVKSDLKCNCFKPTLHNVHNIFYTILFKYVFNLYIITVLIAIRYYTSTKPYAHSTFCTCIATKPKKKSFQNSTKKSEINSKSIFSNASFMFSYDSSCCGRTPRELSFFPKIFSSKPLIPHFPSSLSLPSPDGGITHVQSNCAS